MPIVISGTGVYNPPHVITNEELVESFNLYVAKEHASCNPNTTLQDSSAEFIKKASGIERRYCVDKEGILDVSRMRPRIESRPDEQLSLQAEMGVAASLQALEAAGVGASEVDAVLVACSNFQRPYPAIAVELQAALGAPGFAFDLNVACSSATFGVAQAHALLQSGAARKVLVVSPEICTGHLNFRDRDSHFIFGDACTAVLLERAQDSSSPEQYEIVGARLATRFSNNIRNNLGFLTRCEDRPEEDPSLLFYQEGRKVFKEVIQLVSALLEEHLAQHRLNPGHLKCMWLHQANAAMNALIAKRLLGREATEQEAPSILDSYANTSSAGSIIAFHQHREHLKRGDLGVICSFGAGYSIGSVIVRKL
ncbi:MAG: beta-ketoacyl-ACP synthase III [Vulcanimicrobiota bacterium]